MRCSDKGRRTSSQAEASRIRRPNEGSCARKIEADPFGERKLDPYEGFAARIGCPCAVGTTAGRLPAGTKGIRVFSQFVWANTPTCRGNGPFSASDALTLQAMLRSLISPLQLVETGSTCPQSDSAWARCLPLSYQASCDPGRLENAFAFFIRRAETELETETQL